MIHVLNCLYNYLFLATSAAIKVGVAYYIGYYYILSKSIIKVFINRSMFHRIISSWSFVLRYLDYAFMRAHTKEIHPPVGQEFLSLV